MLCFSVHFKKCVEFFLGSFFGGVVKKIEKLVKFEKKYLFEFFRVVIFVGLGSKIKFKQISCWIEFEIFVC